MKNKGIGARVIVKEVLVRINPEEKWVYVKNIGGTIVERKPEYEHYWHSCTGVYTHVRKNLIINSVYSPIAVQLDNDFKDIEGNNIIIVRGDFEVKYIETLPKKKRVISETSYLNALKTIELYEQQNN